MKRDVVVIGGGVAGLATGALLARGGAAVTVLEKGNQVGGRANCHEDQGFTLNYGPHATYRPRTGFLARVLERLGQPPIEHGRVDPLRCHFSIGDRWGAVGASPLQVLGTSLLPLVSRVRLLRLMAAIRSCRPESAADVSWGEWVDQRTRDRSVRRFLMALTTLNTYARPAEDLSAAFVLGHFQRSLFTRDGVGYMSKGWGTMHRRFLDAIAARGGEVITGAGVAALETSGGRVTAAVTDNGRYEAEAFALTLPPQEIAALAEAGSTLYDEATSWGRLQDVRAHCIDLGLSRRLRQDLTLIFDGDQDLYFSLHSDVTPGLAPPGGQLLHAMAYLSADECSDDRLSDARFEALEAELDRHFAGWREAAVVRRAMRSVRVASARPSVRQQGSGRVPFRAAALSNLYFAGDGRNLPYNLVENSLASALEVADAILSVLAAPRVRAAAAGSAAVWAQSGRP